MDSDQAPETTCMKLLSKEQEVFEVPREVALRSITIKDIAEDTDMDVPVPLPMVNSKTLTKVIEYCTYHHAADKEEKPEDEQKVWDREFLKVDDEGLFSLILASNYLNLKPLLDLACKAVADEIKGKTPEEIRTRFNIKNDFTPEEEADVMQENAWCEQR